MGDNGFILLINAIEDDELRYDLNIYKKQLRDASDPLSMPEQAFRSIYRLSRQTAHDVIVEIAPFLNDAQREDISLPKSLKVVAALHFFAQGSYQKATGQDFFVSMSQASISRCINEVTFALNNHMAYYVKFPLTAEERAVEKQGFMNMPNGFPGIIGAIDCTHVAIVSPPSNHPEVPAIVFYNRKGFYSLNVQIICNSQLKILSINAKYPGSVHDSAIWTTSRIKQHLTQNYNNGDRSSWLLGDSGYPLEPWIMTPIISNNLTLAEQAYNNSHKSTRNVIERLNGVLKGRFRCLLKHRVLHYDPATSARIINACAILHNICIMRNEINVENEVAAEPRDEGQRNAGNLHNNWLREGRLIRERIIRDYFNN